MEPRHLSPLDEVPEGLDEPRLILEHGQARRIAEVVASPLRQVGYRLVRVKLSTATSPVLQIMAEKPDGTMSVEDCEAASMSVSPHLDLDDPISAPYRLEMSSPGIDRPLVRESDFRRALGHEARIELDRPLDGRKRFRGIVEQVETVEGQLAVDLRLADDKGEETVARIALADIGEARLVMTDALIRYALHREKRGIKDAKEAARKAKAAERAAAQQRKLEKEARRHGTPKASLGPKL